MTEDSKNNIQMSKCISIDSTHQKPISLNNVKKIRAISIVFDLAGLLFFIAGILYYIAFSQLPKNTEKFTDEFLQNLFLHWNVFAVIMMVSGMLIITALLILLISFLLTISPNNNNTKKMPLEINSSSKLSFKALCKHYLWIIPFVIPPIFGLLYEPINTNLTVKHFGCGCPKLTPSDIKVIDFNANTFNTILWGIILFVCLLLWTNLTNHITKKSIRGWTASIGIIVLLFMCLNLCALSLWL